MAQPDAVDELLDARAELRRLRVELTDKRIALHKCPQYLAYKRVKAELSAIGDQFEECLTSLEQKQGRLPFMAEDKAAAAPSVPLMTASGRPKRAPRAEGPRA